MTASLRRGVRGVAPRGPLLSLPITILLTPFSLVPFALLYIRAREAEGKLLAAGSPWNGSRRCNEPCSWMIRACQREGF